jgi:predicted GH43/DUF377 family glycosyl hydrolase
MGEDGQFKICFFIFARLVMKLIKYPGNPVLEPRVGSDWENLCVLNPAVWYEESEKTFHMLYRAAADTDEHYIYLGYAYSHDGFNFIRRERPALIPDFNGSDGGGIEDPRIIKMGEWYYITYASRPYAPGRYWLNEPKPWFNPPKEGPIFLKENSTLTHLAITRDFKQFKKLGRITDARFDDRDVIIFPEKIKGKYVKLSRPMQWSGKGYPCKSPSIWISFSDDMMEWHEKPVLLYEGKSWWEDLKTGGSCPPIKTEYGWFFIYHGVSKRDKAYRTGAMLLDTDNPLKIIAATKDFIMEPEYDFETKGFYNGCVFPTANVLKDGTLYVYYGAGDKVVCVATCNFGDLLRFMIEECKIS